MSFPFGAFLQNAEFSCFKERTIFSRNRTIEPFRLQKTTQIITSNCWTNTAKSITKLCLQVQQVFQIPLRMVTPPVPWAACSNTWQLFVKRFFLIVKLKLFFWHPPFLICTWNLEFLTNLLNSAELFYSLCASLLFQSINIIFSALAFAQFNWRVKILLMCSKDLLIFTPPLPWTGDPVFSHRTEFGRWANAG